MVNGNGNWWPQNFRGWSQRGFNKMNLECFQHSGSCESFRTELFFFFFFWSILHLHLQGTWAPWFLTPFHLQNRRWPITYSSHSRHWLHRAYWTIQRWLAMYISPTFHFFFFGHRVLLWSPSWPQTHNSPVKCYCHRCATPSTFTLPLSHHIFKGSGVQTTRSLGCHSPVSYNDTRRLWF